MWAAGDTPTVSSTGVEGTIHEIVDNIIGSGRRTGRSVLPGQAKADRTKEQSALIMGLAGAQYVFAIRP